MPNEFVRPTPYICEMDGHIMDRWYSKTGPPKATVSRSCVIPGCRYYEVKEASTA